MFVASSSVLFGSMSVIQLVVYGGPCSSVLSIGIKVNVDKILNCIKWVVEELYLGAKVNIRG